MYPTPAPRPHRGPAHLGLHVVDREHAAVLAPPCLSLPPTAFLKAHALLSHRPVSDARTDHREATMSFLGELGDLDTGGNAIHPRRARNLLSTALAPASLGSLRRVHFAYAVSITVLFPEDVLRAVGLGLGGLSESGNGNKATAECTTARTFGKSPASIRLSTMLSPPMHRFLRMSRLHPRASAPATLSPIQRRFSRSNLQRAPAHPPLAPASYNTPSKRSKHAQNTHAAYNELVASATPTTSRPHPPPRPRPRPAPGHHDLATQALATRRACPISTII
ncbi:hypothetical protein B0H14DRAFT_3884157 [Mycena olivaceomarginata]|nr:hypothetical protein B0H14DRAFT_3884157 [Mycena olivaceomarginata]